MNDADLVGLCQATYVSPASISVARTEVYACVTHLPDYLVVAFRGSITPLDWLRDIAALVVIPRKHPTLGFCHAGFADAADSVADEVLKVVGNRPYVLTGHSLGGAEAVGVGALMVLAGKAPARIATFGAPRFGMRKFVDVLKDVPIAQYWRGNDPVTDLPFFIPPLFRYEFTRAPLIHVGVSQPDAFSSHHIAGYVEDVTSYLKLRPT